MQYISTELEKWIPVVGYEGYYEVSDHGRVRSIDREITTKTGLTRQCTGRVRKQVVRKDGYLSVSLSRESETSVLLVHRLVLEAFVGACPGGMEACHSDGSRDNNHISNLRWDTRSENQFDRVKHGTHHNSAKVECSRGHELADWNCKPSSLKRGQRQCIACSRAHSYAGKYPAKKLVFDQLSDQYFKSIKQSAESAAT